MGGKQRIVIHKVKGTRYPAKPDHRPGSIVSVDKDSFKIACADGDVTILVCPSDSRTPVATQEIGFSAGDRTDLTLRVIEK